MRFSINNPVKQIRNIAVLMLLSGVSCSKVTSPVISSTSPVAGEERNFSLGNTGQAIRMCWIPAGTFQMGSPNGEQDQGGDEWPVHQVTFAEGFWMGKYEVTQVQWRAVMHYDSSNYRGDNLPVQKVSWDEVQMFERLLNERFRLPSEAEWEYAYRAGTTTRFYWGDDTIYDQIDTYAWYDGFPGSTHQVGGKTANAWGLHDMAGNVLEWCEDFYHDNVHNNYYYRGYLGAPTDGSAWTTNGGTDRVLRGGAWDSLPEHCRAAFRSRTEPFRGSDPVGFRVVATFNP